MLVILHCPHRVAAVTLSLLVVGCGGPNSTLCRDGTGHRGPIVSRVGEDTASVTWIASGDAAYAAAFRRSDQDWRPTTVEIEGPTRRILLAGLESGVEYEYRLERGVGAEVLRGGFRTPPANGDDTVRFSALGDSGGGCESQYAVAERLEAGRPDFVLHTGDVLYSKNPADLDPLFYRPFASTLARAPFFLALGNHDVDTALLDAMDLPTNDVDGSERFYSFDWGGAHFVALDSNQSRATTSTQWTWLERDLRDRRADWTILFLHHPPYSSARTSHREIRRALEPLLDRYGVDLVLSGHDHNYERTFPMRDDEVVDGDQDPTYVDPRGTIYVVTGGGGRSLYPSGESAFTAHSESSYHVSEVEIEGRILRLRAVRSDGSILDEMTIRKTT